VAERQFAGATSASVKPSNVITMSLDSTLEQVAGDFVGDIAAAEEDGPRPAVLQRLPLSFRPEARFSVLHTLSYGDVTTASVDSERPEGSLEARGFGNAMHAFLEVLTKRLADGLEVDSLLHEVEGWTSRIVAVLRAEGLAPSIVDRLAPRVKVGLNNVLKDAEGLWLLGAHEGATSEFALTSWLEKRNSVRMDRVFPAGARPLDPGKDHLWIIDYKTATHGREGVEQFLAEERAKYEPQLHAYAQMMTGHADAGRLRVGLYYPMLARLVWWTPQMLVAD